MGLITGLAETKCLNTPIYKPTFAPNQLLFFMSKREKRKSQAKALFLEGVSQAFIAEVMGVAPKTVGTWAKQGNWHSLKSESDMMRMNSEEIVQRLIAYQLKVLEQRTIDNLEAADQYGTPLPLLDKGDIDALQKLFTTIKRSEMKWRDYIRFTKEFTVFIEQHDRELAKTITELGQLFLNEKSKVV